jgi:hypothetical protein
MKIFGSGNLYISMSACEVYVTFLPLLECDEYFTLREEGYEVRLE